LEILFEIRICKVSFLEKLTCYLGDNPDAFLKKLQKELAKRGNPWIAGERNL
jgi:hypothetical protein